MQGDLTVALVAEQRDAVTSSRAVRSRSRAAPPRARSTGGAACGCARRRSTCAPAFASARPSAPPSRTAHRSPRSSWTTPLFRSGSSTSCRPKPRGHGADPRDPLSSRCVPWRPTPRAPTWASNSARSARPRRSGRSCSDLGVALVGVDVANGHTQVLLFGARPWFQEKVAALEAVERGHEWGRMFTVDVAGEHDICTGYGGGIEMPVNLTVVAQTDIGSGAKDQRRCLRYRRPRPAEASSTSNASPSSRSGSGASCSPSPTAWAGPPGGRGRERARGGVAPSFDGAAAAGRVRATRCSKAARPRPTARSGRRSHFPGRERMGATLTAVCLHGRTAYIAEVGDLAGVPRPRWSHQASDRATRATCS